MVVEQAAVARAIGSSVGCGWVLLVFAARAVGSWEEKAKEREEVAWKNMQAYAGPSFDHGSWWKKIIYYSDPI
jgi:hypothetical protein